MSLRAHLAKLVAVLVLAAVPALGTVVLTDGSADGIASPVVASDGVTSPSSKDTTGWG
ncbi:hypothetical protein ACIF80_12045 [Streptomyces sp. NPDC085927]|uniref:hypothetical protein n=1 Tax=Streptomyces sp. NPDC085927 TaxID=3365738 RepID=UPI0037CFF7F6